MLDDASAGWFIDPTPNDWSEFSFLSDHPFITVADDGLASDGVDLWTTAAHELLHALGLASGGFLGQLFLRFQQDPNGYLTDTGIGDDRFPGKGTLWKFESPNVTAVFTSNNGGSNGADVARPTHLAFPQVTAKPGLTPTWDLLNPGSGHGVRALPSNLDALILQDAYGYEIVMPETFGTSHTILDETTGELLVQGRYNWLTGEPVDTVDISVTRTGANLIVSVDPENDAAGVWTADAFISVFPASSVSSIRVRAWQGETSVTLGPTLGVPVDVTPGLITSHISLVIQGGPGNDTFETSASQTIVNGIPISHDVDDLTLDGGGGNDTFIANGSSTTYLGGPGNDSFTIYATGNDPVLIDGQDGSDIYVIHLAG